MPEKALIVDDDPAMLDILKKYLENHGFSVQSARNGKEALLSIRVSRPDIVVTDAEMPLLDGFALCRKIKEEKRFSAIPVIIMSGKKISESDMVSGYAFGADDYVVKPFSYPILLAKIKAVLKRSAPPGIQKKTQPKIKAAGIEIDTENRSARIKNRQLKLTAKEFDLLAALAAREGQLLSISALLETVWGYDPANYNDPHTIEVHISNLRKKLGPLGKQIISIPGHGYKFSRSPK